MLHRGGFLLLVSCVAATAAFAQEVPQAFTGARIIPVEGEPIDAGTLVVEAGVIKALGFDPEDLPELFGEETLTVNRWGAVRVDYATMETSLPGVYAAGDIVRGASLVVWAIKDGRDAAEAMHKAMRAQERASKVAAE